MFALAWVAVRPLHCLPDIEVCKCPRCPCILAVLGRLWMQTGFVVSMWNFVQPRTETQ